MGQATSIVAQRFFIIALQDVAESPRQKHARYTLEDLLNDTADCALLDLRVNGLYIHFIHICRFGRKFELRKPVEKYQIFYIGFEGPSLTNLILNYNRCQVKLRITNQYSRTISIFILFLM